ncbi:phosphohydroxy-L-lysine phospho-lyase [Seminavis robusta]|uniref:Phosphohydroxy-L-lysine phospho-lyase n=1 Tax=Seminavis robusta TaxID=568900 RepID=A0A9N8D5D9_9STRA|nr:phosphohydroxy-L-lysine phospho-lyase [Seminavis robusta]|eukprot:Sro9_g007530.1 phosphohydroxy-L-lysine phospho-lyase (511) ;mRNA; f:177726-179383
MSTLSPLVPFLGSILVSVILLKQEQSEKPEQQKKRTMTRNAVSMTKEAVMKLRRKYFSKSVSISYANSGPLMIVQGRGSHLIDENGVAYLDTRNNVAHCGHSHPRVVKAVQDQVAQLNTNTRYLHPNVATLGQRLSNLFPDPLEIVFFVNSGSEANDLALRLARACTGSKNTIVVDGSYHGHTMTVLEVSPYKYEQGGEFDLQPPKMGLKFQSPGRHIWKVPAPDIYRGPHRDIRTAGREYAKTVEEACHFYQKECGEKVGAFLLEGGMSTPGAILSPPGYLAHSVKAVRDAGGVFIADEVQSGFGRFGTSFWAFQHQHPGHEEEVVVPDIVTMGKPFGNGMPLAAVVTTRAVAEAFETNAHIEYFNTFGGNPVCAAAGLAVLDTIEAEKLQQKAVQVGGYLQDKFMALQQHLEIIGDVRGSGFFIGVELVRDRTTLEAATEETSYICSVLKEKYKILTSIDGIFENVLMIKPPMVFSKADADYFVESFEGAVGDMKAAGDVRSMEKTPT